MYSIALALAAFAGPNANPNQDPRSLFQFNDYPPEAIANRETGSVVTSLLIDPTGKVERCTVIYSSHSVSLDRATCRIITERALFRPAVNDAGKPIYSIYVAPPVTWWVSDAPQLPLVTLKPDAEIGLNGAPNGITLPLNVTVSYVVTAAGQIQSCSASQPGKYPDALVAIACQQSSLPAPVPTKNKAGQPVDVSYTSTAHFFVGKP